MRMKPGLHFGMRTSRAGIAAVRRWQDKRDAGTFRGEEGKRQLTL